VSLTNLHILCNIALVKNAIRQYNGTYIKFAHITGRVYAQYLACHEQNVVDAMVGSSIRSSTSSTNIFKS